MKEKVENKLKEIWKKYKGKFESDEVSCLIDRSYVYATPEKNTILITGINPSYVESKKEEKLNTYTLSSAKHSHYTRIRNLVNCTYYSAYLDLFYFRNTSQSLIAKILKEKNGVEFLADQLAVTKETIEWIQPKVILVLNKGAWAFYGLNPSSVWMGYEFQKEKDMAGGELHRIVGFRVSNEIIAPEIKETNLVGTYVYFSRSLNRIKTEDFENMKKDISEIIEKHLSHEMCHCEPMDLSDFSNDDIPF